MGFNPKTGDQVVEIGDSTELTFDHGRNSNIDQAAIQITTVSVVANHGVLVKAANGNSGTVFVGNSDVTADATDATDGFELAAGESITVEVDNVNKIYVIGSADNQVAYWLTV